MHLTRQPRYPQFAGRPSAKLTRSLIDKAGEECLYFYPHLIYRANDKNMTKSRGRLRLKMSSREIQIFNKFIDLEREELA